MSLNDENWNKIFQEYNILNKIESDNQFIINADDIKKFREPRLMAKIDHKSNLPEIFQKNHLSILPISRRSYVIAPIETFSPFNEEKMEAPKPISVKLPEHLQSLQPDNIANEAMALDCAYSCGILAHFLEEEELFPTVSGRMKSGKFEFEIDSTLNAKSHQKIMVVNSQIEIDAAYEGIHNLSLFEAKNTYSDDFMVRQLYYPYRTWAEKVTKPIKSVFLIYSDGGFTLYQYRFSNPNYYNSIELVKRGIYQISEHIGIDTIEELLKQTIVEPEPKDVPFPQADTMGRITNLLDMLNDQDLSKQEITKTIGFDKRQTDYYVTAGKYLGLIEKGKRDGNVSLTALGKKIARMSVQNRQLELIKQILKHYPFNETLKIHLKSGSMPDRDYIKKLIRSVSNISGDTISRRASTVISWTYWILSICNYS